MVCTLDQVRSRIARQGQELTGMTAFAAVGYKIVNRRTKCCRRREISLISSISTMAHDASTQCRDMIQLFTDGAGRNMVRVAAVAGFTISANARVRETLRRLEWIRGSVAKTTILVRRQM